jgi:hypothetical protein
MVEIKRKEKTKMSLIGKFVFYGGKEYSQCGEIVGESGEYVLVKWDRLNGEPSPTDEAAVLIALVMMITKPGKEAPIFEFYDSRDKLEAFNRWLNSPLEDSTEKSVAAKLN